MEQTLSFDIIKTCHKSAEGQDNLLPSDDEMNSVPDLEPEDLVKNAIRKYKGRDQVKIISSLINTGMCLYVARCIDFVDSENKDEVSDMLLKAMGK